MLSIIVINLAQAIFRCHVTSQNQRFEYIWKDLIQVSKAQVTYWKDFLMIKMHPVFASKFLICSFVYFKRADISLVC